MKPKPFSPLNHFTVPKAMISPKMRKRPADHKSAGVSTNVELQNINRGKP
jgi:hypothetical protein